MIDELRSGKQWRDGIQSPGRRTPRPWEPEGDAVRAQADGAAQREGAGSRCVPSRPPGMWAQGHLLRTRGLVAAGRGGDQAQTGQWPEASAEAGDHGCEMLLSACGVLIGLWGVTSLWGVVIGLRGVISL